MERIQGGQRSISATSSLIDRGQRIHALQGLGVARSSTCLKRFEGVEDVTNNCKSSKVVGKGEKANPQTVLERVLTKSHTQVKLLSSISKPKVEEEEKPPKGQLPRKHLKCLEPVVEEEELVKARNLGDKVRLPRVTC
jgi:hypothetical protein